MKPLPPAAAHASPLTKPIEHSALTAHAKAQRLRTHAQEKRGFRDHLQTKQKGAEHVDKAEGSENAVEEAVPAGADKKVVVKTPSTADAAHTTPSEQPADGKTITAKESVQQHLPEHAAGQTASDPTEPFLQQVVAQVMEGVDPALKLKPVAFARAAGTVSGNSANEMRGEGGAVNVQPGTRAGAEASLPADNQAQQADSDIFAAAKTAQPTDSTAARVDGDSSAKPAASTPPPAKPADGGAPAVPGDRAASAVAGAAASINPEVAASRAIEPRLTLTATFSEVSLGTAVSGSNSVTAQLSADKSASTLPSASSPPSLPQQIQQGLEVAMHDLPAPAGERLVTLKLNPSSLGSLRIALHVSGDAVHVRFQVGSAKARASIGKSMEDLKASIGRQGLRVESMEVEEDSALAAPTGLPLIENEGGSPLAFAGSTSPVAGKGFAQLLDAPHGPDGPGAADATGRTPNQAEAAIEDGVLQVLTFRLDAVG